jgi:predicted ArsR family transcriptional regulator
MTSTKESKLTARERIIIFLQDPYKAEKMGQAVQEIADIMGYSKTTVQYRIRELLAEGIIEVNTYGQNKWVDEIWLSEDASTKV